MEKIKHKRSEIQSIIEKRRDWLNENHIQDWNDTDTYEVMKEYANLFASPVSLDTHAAEDTYQKHFDAAKILVPYILSAPRSVGNGGNFEEYILCRDFEEIIENIKLFASQESLKARQAQWVSVEDRLPENILSVVGNYFVYRKGQSPYVATFFGIPVDGSHWHNSGFPVFPTHWMPLPEPPSEKLKSDSTKPPYEK